VKNLAEKITAIRTKRDRLKVLLNDLERSGESQISLTDPDSRAMAAHTHVAVGYNAQIAVDAKRKLIVEQAVTNQVLDMDLLTQTAEPARAVLEVAQIDVVADRGYFKIEDIEACEKAGMTPHVPKPQRGSAVREGLFRKDEFRYDAERGRVCLSGRTAAASVFVVRPARAHEDQLRRQAGLRRLRHPRQMHRQPVSVCIAPGERSRAGADGGTTEGAAGYFRPSLRDRRASVRVH
jgi:IS5 family transposase